ncbi:HTH-type transcriptional repressor YvoA [Halomonas elongata]|uniref:HTH-type transcriptional repressor YvoA n=2 Tax=Halomonas elongata TaxID=2746 RepID=A0A1B8NWF8_HALEL|nr:HTH-type transcriptional repressor YvoA [Halomonas elongata]
MAQKSRTTTKGGNVSITLLPCHMDIYMKTRTLRADERLPLYQRLREEIQARISSGEWKPDTPIPTEAELAREYGVAVGTVRKAVDTLVNDGLLQRNQGRGTFVRRPDFESSFLRFFRQTNAAGERTVPEGQVIERRIAVPPGYVSDALDLPPQAETIHLKRIRRIEGIPTLCEDIWLPYSRFQALAEIPLQSFGNLLYPFYEHECGQLIAAAKESLRVSCADRQTATALEITVGSPVVIIDRIAQGYDHTPLEYRRSRGGASTFHYQIDIS